MEMVTASYFENQPAIIARLGWASDRNQAFGGWRRFPRVLAIPAHLPAGAGTINRVRARRLARVL